MRLLVCGGRHYDDWNRVCKELHTVLGERGVRYEDLTIVHGAARGADKMAGRWATINGVKQERHAAEWEKYGRSAGAIRNVDMLQSGLDLVIAFPGGTGTQHMVGIAKKAGVEVICIDG